MKEAAPRPNVSAEELRRDYLASDPVSRMRRGFELSRFGMRLQTAMKHAQDSKPNAS
jgi:hypothetical protein